MSAAALGSAYPFCLHLGGVAVQITAAVGLPLTAVSSDKGGAFASFATSTEESGPVLSAHLAPLGQEYTLPAVERTLFAFEGTALHRTTGGSYVQVSCPPAGKPLWIIETDAAFSRFAYFIDPARPVDPCKQVANRLLLSHSFIRHNGLIVHGAGGSVQGKGMVFAAPSGTGKSTLSHLLLTSSQNHLFSEERLILRSSHETWRVWGTPWHGTGSIARNESAPLSALLFLSQAATTSVCQLAPSQALRRLLQVVSIPWYSQEWTEQGLALCETLLQTIPAFELAFRPDQTAVQAVEQLACSLA